MIWAVTDALVARLQQHRTIGSAPAEELAWLAAHGAILTLAPGERLLADQPVVDSLWVVLSGRFSIRIDRGAGPRKVMEWVGGDVSGYLPYSRMTSAPGDVTVEEATEVLTVHRNCYRELITGCPELTAMLVHVMVDRARQFTFSDFHVEKMNSLGRWAAGLAHELNNPASAVVRGAKSLHRQLDDLDASARALGEAGLPPAAVAMVDQVRKICESETGRVGRSPLERVDREDAIESWLRAHHVELPDIEALARSSVTMEVLDRLAAALDDRTLPLALRAITASRIAHQTASEVEAAASRVHTLVLAVKGFSRLDQSAAPVPFALGQGLRDTLAVLNSKARGKDVSVTLDIAADLPQVVGVAGELNQVWANLIDNALDAAPAKGHVQVIACRLVDGYVTVKVVDNGPGIPEQLRSQVFDQFFTTKPLGQGTGLGLDIARRIVRNHDGVLEFDTRPGRTEFRVVLPPAPAA
jgi:signal transduction histidine kinase